MDREVWWLRFCNFNWDFDVHRLEHSSFHFSDQIRDIALLKDKAIVDRKRRDFKCVGL